VTVRRLSQLLECVHAPVYFAPEPQEAYASLGLRGYWRGYFASRAAVLGTPTAEQVTTLFGGFAQAMVARAIPGVWDVVDPADVTAARQAGAAAALRRLVAPNNPVGTAADLVTEVVRGLVVDGRPMAAAEATLPTPDEPIAALWRGCTVLREFRGDAHLAVLADYDLAWPRPHLLLAATGRIDDRQREYRGWSEAEWDAAIEDLRARGLYGTAAGSQLVEEIDARTDRLVSASFGDVERLEAVLAPVAVHAAGAVPFPNAMGLPAAVLSE
jgi:hypothetical protein